MELVVLIVVGILMLALLILGFLTTEKLSEAGLVGLGANGVVGVVLLFLTNLVVSPPIPINLITVLICVIGGVVGWLIIVVLYLLQVAFYVPVIDVPVIALFA